MNGTSIAESIRQNWGWLLALGIAYIIMGLVIAGSPMAATIAVDILIGFVLIIGGVDLHNRCIFLPGTGKGYC